MQEIFKRNNICILQEKIEIGKTGHITNCYIVWDSNNMAIVIDPAFDANRIIKIIEENNLKLCAIFITHCHIDHIVALNYLQKEYNVPVYGHIFDLENINNPKINCKEIINVNLDYIDFNNFNYLSGGEEIKVSDMVFEIINTPGHTKGSIVIFEKTANVLFTGDTIFENSYGRTDLNSGSFEDMKKSLNDIFNRFDNIECYSGHGNNFNLSNVKRKINLLLAFKE